MAGGPSLVRNTREEHGLRILPLDLLAEIERVLQVLPGFLVGWHRHALVVPSLVISLEEYE